MKYTILAAALFMVVAASSTPRTTDPAPGSQAYAAAPAYLFQSTHRVRSFFMGPLPSSGYGSAFAVDLGEFGISGHKYLMTAGHVVLNFEDRYDPAVLVEVEIRKGSASVWVRASVVAADKDRDLCLLEVEDELDGAVPLAPDASIEVGSPVWAVGCPAGTTVTPTFGYLVSKYMDEMGDMTDGNWQCSAPIYSGNSGGPVFDANTGRVIGVEVAGAREGERGLASNVAFLVSIETIRGFLKKPTKKIAERANKK